MSFDQEGWEQRWEQVLRDRPDVVANKPPHAYLTDVAAALPPGRALDAGCGHGAETLWLAAQGWTVTAVDFAAAALAHGRATAETLGLEGIDWVEADLGVWAPEPAAYDLVNCLYVHVAGDIAETFGRLAAGVAPGGTILLVGHLDTPGQTQVTVPAALEALAGWEIEVAEERPRAGGGNDAVVRAVRP